MKTTYDIIVKYVNLVKQLKLEIDFTEQQILIGQIEILKWVLINKN